MYFQILIELKPELSPRPSRRGALSPAHRMEARVDLDEATLSELYLSKYERGETIMLNGRPIQPDEITRFRVFKNGKSAQQVIADIYRESESAARAGVIAFPTPTEVDVAMRGIEITNDAIKGPPGFGRTSLSIQPNNVRSEATTTIGADNIRVFISHSAKDEKIAAALIDCMAKSMVVPDGGIRCTSVAGFKLRVGDDANETLRSNLEHASIVIGLLSPESLASGYVIMELGAAWGLKRLTCAILTAGVEFRKIPGPLAGKHAILASSESDMAAFMEQMAQVLGWPQRRSPSMMEGVKQFAQTAQKNP